MKNGTHTHQVRAALTDLREDTRALLAATADTAEEKVVAARKRLAAAMNMAAENIEEKAIKGAKAADKLVRDNPYRSLGIALGVGALLGFFLSRRSRD